MKWALLAPLLLALAGYQFQCRLEGGQAQATEPCVNCIIITSDVPGYYR